MVSGQIDKYIYLYKTVLQANTRPATCFVRHIWANLGNCGQQD